VKFEIETRVAGTKMKKLFTNRLNGGEITKDRTAFMLTIFQTEIVFKVHLVSFEFVDC